MMSSFLDEGVSFFIIMELVIGGEYCANKEYCPIIFSEGVLGTETTKM